MARRSAEQDEDDGIAAKEPRDKAVRLEDCFKDRKEGRRSVRGLHVHLADETVLVHALALGALGLLGPHLLDILEDHVAVSVKGLDAGQQLAVVSAGNQDLGVCAGGGLQERQGTGGELVLLDESDLIFSVEMQDARLVFFFYGMCFAQLA